MTLNGSIWLREVHIYIALRTFLPIQYGMSQTPPHADTTSSLYPMGLRGQTNKHLLRGHTNPQPYKYCMFWTQMGSHDFKMRLQD